LFLLHSRPKQALGVRYFVTAVVFAAAWLLWSGLYTPLLLLLGALSCALVLILAVRTGFFEVEAYTLNLGPRLPRYWLWLLGEIVKANVAVARIILSPRMPIEPTIVTLDARHLPAVAQATLANAITLTPGTVSLDVDRGMIEVHCLTTNAARDLNDGEMVRRAARLSEH
jgi:multicomponent Na+:H+ antiporter subunit E